MLKPWVLKLFQHVAKTSFSARFRQLLIKPVLKTVLKLWVLKLFRHDAKTNLIASFSKLQLKPVLKPWVLKLFRHVARTSFSESFSQLAKTCAKTLGTKTFPTWC